jgi:hypothetical protein
VPRAPGGGPTTKNRPSPDPGVWEGWDGWERAPGAALATE